MNRKTRRTGVSLAELLVVMSAASVVLTLSATLIHRAMLTHTLGVKRIEVERTAWRLSSQLRRDARLAGRAIVEEPADSIRLTFTAPFDPSIVYRFYPDKVVRTEPREGSERREEYRLPTPTTWTVATDPESNTPILLVESGAAPRGGAHARAAAPLRLRVETRLAQGGGR